MPEITIERLKELETKRGSMTPEQVAALDKAQAARITIDPDFLQRSHAYWQGKQDFGEQDRDSMLHNILADGMGVQMQGRTVADGLKEFYGVDTDPQEAFEKFMAIAADGERTHEFFTMDDDERKAYTKKNLAVETARMNLEASGVYGASARKIAAMPGYQATIKGEPSEKQLDEQLENDFAKAFAESPKIARQWAAQRLSPRNERMAWAVGWSKDPVKTALFYRDEIEGMDPAQRGYFDIMLNGINPELTEGFMKQAGIGFVRGAKNAVDLREYFSKSGQGGKFLGSPVWDNEVEVFDRISQEFTEAELNDLWQADGSINPAYEDRFTKLAKTATGGGKVLEALIERPGDENIPFRKEEIDLYKAASRELYNLGRDYRDRERLAREIRAATAPKYADIEGLRGEFVNASEGLGYMVTLAGISQIPVVGQSLSLTSMYATQQAEWSKKLTYEHGVDPALADLITTPFAMAYAAVERLQVKGLDPKIAPYIENPKFRGIMGKYLGEATLRRMGTSGHYATQLIKNRAMVAGEETFEEWVQEDIDFAMMAAAKYMAKADGIDLGEEWEENFRNKLAAARAMPIITLVGGGMIQTGRSVGKAATGDFRGAAKELFPPEAGANWADMRLDPETFNAMQKTRAALRDTDGDLIPVSDVEMWRKHHDSEAFGDLNTGKTYNNIDEWMVENGYNPETDRARFENNSRLYDTMLELKRAEIDEMQRTVGAYETNPDEVPLPLDSDPFWGAVDPILEQVAGPMGFEVHKVDTMDEARAVDPSLANAPDFNGVALTKSGKAILVKKIIERTAKQRGAAPHGMAYTVASEEIVGHLGQSINPEQGSMLDQISKALGVDGMLALLPEGYGALAEDMQKKGATQADVLAMLSDEVLSKGIANIDLRKVEAAREGGSLKQRMANLLDNVFGTKSTAQINSDLLVDLVRKAVDFARQGSTLNQDQNHENTNDQQRPEDHPENQRAQPENGGVDLSQPKTAAAAKDAKAKRVTQSSREFARRMASSDPVRTQLRKSYKIKTPAKDDPLYEELYGRSQKEPGIIPRKFFRKNATAGWDQVLEEIHDDYPGLLPDGDPSNLDNLAFVFAEAIPRMGEVEKRVSGDLKDQVYREFEQSIANGIRPPHDLIDEFPSVWASALQRTGADEASLQQDDPLTAQDMMAPLGEDDDFYDEFEDGLFSLADFSEYDPTAGALTSESLDGIEGVGDESRHFQKNIRFSLEQLEFGKDLQLGFSDLPVSTGRTDARPTEDRHGILRQSAKFAPALRTIGEAPLPRTGKITSPDDVKKLIGDLVSPAQELLFIIPLDAQYRIMPSGVVMATAGTVNSSPAQPAHLLQALESTKATYLIIAHNHPSGDVQPSREDIVVTKAWAEALEMIGRPGVLLDHIVLGKDKVFSLRENTFYNPGKNTGNPGPESSVAHSATAVPVSMLWATELSLMDFAGLTETITTPQQLLNLAKLLMDQGESMALVGLDTKLKPSAFVMVDGEEKSIREGARILAQTPGVSGAVVASKKDMDAQDGRSMVKLFDSVGVKLLDIYDMKLNHSQRESGLVRFSMAARQDARELTVRILAGHIYQGRGADENSAKAILRGLKAEIPKKKDLAVLIDDAKQIAAEIMGEGEKIISERDLSRFINNAADRNIFRKRMQEIESRYFEGGAGWMEAQRKHALQLEAHAELLKRSRQGMDIGEISDALGFNLSEILQRLDADYEQLKAAREERKQQAQERNEPDESDQDSEKQSGGVDQQSAIGNQQSAIGNQQSAIGNQQSAIVREPAQEILWRIADRVASRMHQQGLTKHKNTQTAMRDPWVLEEYRKTLATLLDHTVGEHAYGPARERLRLRIQKLGQYKSFRGVRNAAQRILEEAYEARASEDIEAGIKRVFELTKQFGGVIKSRQPDIRRAVTGRIHLFYKMIRGGKIGRTEYQGAVLMDPEAVETEMEELRTFLSDPDQQAPKHLTDEEKQQLTREKTDRLNVLMRFGALKHKSPGEVAEAVDWLEKDMAAAIEAQEKRRHELETWAGGVREKLMAVLPNRLHGAQSAGGFRDENSKAQFLDFRLKGLALYGTGAVRETALKEMDALAFDFGRASFRKNMAVARDNAAFGQAVLEIYANPSERRWEAGEQIDRHKAAAILRELMKKREDYARFSKNGRLLSKANLLQIVGQMAQEDYRKIALMQLELEDRVNDMSDMTTPEIAMALWQTPDEWIKWTSTHGYELNAEQLERLVASIRTAPEPSRVLDEQGRRIESFKYGFSGALLARRLEMVPEIESVLDGNDIKLLDWFRKYYRDNRAELSAKNELITGLPFPVSVDPYYIPAKVDFNRETLGGFTLVMPLVPPGLAPRTFNTRDLDEEANIIELYLKRLDENQQFLQFAELYQRIQPIFNDPKLRIAMENTHGKNYVKQLMVHMRDVLSGTPNKGDSSTNKVIDSLVNWMAVTRLGFNLSLFPRQITSVPAFAMYVDMGKAMKYVAEAGTKEGRDTMAMMLRHPYVKARMQQGHTQVERELYEGLGEHGLSIWETYKRLGRLPTKYGDIVPTLLFGQGYYRALLESDDARAMGEAEAKEWAMDRVWSLVEMSQQSGMLINISEWQRHGGSLGRALGQFISTPQQFWAKQTFDWRELWAAVETEGFGSARAKQAGKQLAKTVALNHLVLPLLYNGMKLLWDAMLGDLPDDDDKKNLLYSMLIGPFAGIFVLGAAIEGTLKAGIEGKMSWGDQVIPMSAVYKDSEHLAAAFNHLLQLEPREMLEELDKLMKGIQPIYRDVRKAADNYSD